MRQGSHSDVTNEQMFTIDFAIILEKLNKKIGVLIILLNFDRHLDCNNFYFTALLIQK